MADQEAVTQVETPVKRVAVSKRLRFEVFKRDSFKCQYCGASAPEVLLEVDHLHRAIEIFGYTYYVLDRLA